MLGIRICSASNITCPVSDGGADVVRHFGVALEKLWLEGVVQAEHVRKDEHLAVALDTGADADRRDSDCRGDTRGDWSGNELEHDRKRSRFFQSLRLTDQALGSFLLAPLNARPSNRVHGLRCEPDVGHDRNTGADESVNGVEHFRTPTLDLDGGHPGLLNCAPA